MDDLESAIAEVLAGKRDHYGQVVTHCEASVRLVVASVLPEDALVDEVVNEAFLTAYLKLREYVAGTDFRAWVRTIAWRTAQNERRRWIRAHKTTRSFRAAALELVAPDVDALATGVGPQVAAELHDCIGRLPERYRNVVNQHYFEGKTCREIGQRAGNREGWARLVLFRARAALISCLKVKGVFDEVRG